MLRAVCCIMQLIVQVRKSGRARKSTEKMLEGKSQEIVKMIISSV